MERGREWVGRIDEGIQGIDGDRGGGMEGEVTSG